MSEGAPNAVESSRGGALAAGDRREVERRAGRVLALAKLLSAFGQWGVILALAVHAWREGGPGAVGAMAVTRAVASAVGGPLLGGLAARPSPRRTLLLTNLSRSVTVLAMAALAAAGVGVVALLALLIVLGMLDPVYDSVSGNLLADVVVHERLAPANARLSAATNTGFLAGSAGTGFVLAAVSVPATLLVLAGAFAMSLVVIARIDVAPRTTRQRGAGSSWSAALDVASSPNLRGAAGFVVILGITDGAVDVLGVCAALGYLGAGEGAAGLLQATIGIGTVVGSSILTSARRAHRLMPAVVAGCALLGFALMSVAGTVTLIVATLLLGVGGVGYAAADVGSATIIQQRASPVRRLRVLGVVVSIKAVSYAVGAALAGFVAARIGARLAFAWAGGTILLVTVALGLAAWARRPNVAWRSRTAA